MRRMGRMCMSTAGASLALLLGLGCRQSLSGRERTEVSRRAARQEASTCEGVPGVSRLRPLTQVQYQNSIRDLFGGTVEASDAYPRPSGAEVTGFSTDASAQLLSGNHAELLARAAEETAMRVMARLSELLPCASSERRTCAEQFVDTYARRAFRRPLTADQRKSLLAVYDRSMRDHGKFALAIAEVTSVILQRPEFVYLSDVGIAEGQHTRKLDDFEVASRLSYLFWDAPPDQSLLRAAVAGELSTGEGVRDQAERLVADERFTAVMQKFVREWTGVRVYRGGDKSPVHYPEFDDTLAQSQQEELDRFVRLALRQGPGGVATLLAGRDTFVNRPLAQLYGLPADTSRSADDWRRVTLGEERAGLLTRAAVLSGLSGDELVSHVKRGHFVLSGLLCVDLGPPPPDAMSRQPVYPLGSTRRERSQILQKTRECGSCHRQIDPIGLGLDEFDAIGRKLPFPVDASGAIANGGDASGPFHGSAQLTDMLKKSKVVQACIATHWLRYSFGRKENADDRCALATLTRALEGSGGDLGVMATSLVATEDFRYRSMESKSDE